MRNIVLITLDGVRADHCSCFGYTKKTTPFLDKISNKSLKFENAIVNGVPTYVSMKGIFTSEYPNSGKVKHRTFPQILNNRYDTAAFHSSPVVSRLSQYDKGFNTFNDYLRRDEKGYQSERFNPIIKTGLKITNKLDIDRDKAKFYYNLINVVTRNKYMGSGFLVEDFYSDLINWYSTIENEDNYFLWVMMMETHFPYVTSDWGRIKNARAMMAFDKFYKAGRITERLTPNLSKREHKLVIDAYDESIKYADKLIERLWNDLKDTDPVFIIHSDHGEAFGEHGFYGHPHEHYEYLSRVPLIIYNADERGEIKEPVSMLRLGSTICELGGLENNIGRPSLLDDTDYKPPIIENKLEEGFKITVRDKEWKLTLNPDKKDELYNIKKDDREKQNLIGAEPDIERELREVAQDHKQKRLEQTKLKEKVEKLKILKKI